MLLFENELFCEDFAKFEQLVRGRRRAASLASETDDELELSRRFREIYRPNGLSDELRVIFRSGSARPELTAKFFYEHFGIVH
jgi:hypothetical protein